MGPYADIKEIQANVSGLRGPYKKKEQTPKPKLTKSKVWEVSEVVGSKGSLANGDMEYKLQSAMARVWREGCLIASRGRAVPLTVQDWYKSSI